MCSVVVCLIQTHKRFKRRLFIRTKNKMRFFGVILFMTFIYFGFSCVVFVCFVLINNVLSNLSCVWILLYNANSHSSFRFVVVVVVLVVVVDGFFVRHIVLLQLI